MLGLILESMNHQDIDLTKRCFVSIGPYCWGRGSSKDEAIKNMAKNNAGRKSPRIVYLVIGDDTSYVDDMGSLMILSGATSEVIERYPKSAFK